MFAIDVSEYFTCVINCKCFLCHFYLTNPANELIFSYVKDKIKLFFGIFSVQNNGSGNICFLGKGYQISKGYFLLNQ